MSDSHELLDDDTLATLLDRRRRNLRYLEQQAAKQGGQISLQLHNDLQRLSQ